MSIIETKGTCGRSLQDEYLCDALLTSNGKDGALQIIIFFKTCFYEVQT